MTECIYHDQIDGHSVKLTREHPLSKGLGTFRGLETLRGCICSDCNKRISEFEDVEFHVGVLGLLRWQAGAYNNPDTRSPSYNKARGKPPLVVTAKHPITDETMLAEGLYSSNAFTFRRQVIFIAPDGTREFMSVKDWFDQRDEIIAAIRRHSRMGFTKVKVKFDDDEYEAVKSLMAMIGGQSDFGTDDCPECTWTYSAELRMSDEIRLRRIAAKASFHYMLAYMKSVSGAESIFDSVKRSIISSENVADCVSRNSQPLSRGVRNGVPEAEWVHVLACSWNKDDIRAHCRFFDRSISQVIGFDVLLARHDRIVIPEPHMIAHRFRYVERKKNGMNGIVEKLPVSTFLALDHLYS